MLKSLSVEMYLVVNCPMVKHTSGIEAHVDASVYHLVGINNNRSSLDCFLDSYLVGFNNNPS